VKGTEPRDNLSVSGTARLVPIKHSVTPDVADMLIATA
jgi:hypothetical protein